ncbi:MerR family transcriptional regulator [Lutibacter sp. B2]|nr:MerR family transcriptional regulator [Lutibacter sp. B2]
MAEIRNCKQCGRIFQYTGVTQICSRCHKKDDEEYQMVKEYVYDHRGATITEISEETGVDEDRILRYIRAGKLEIIGEDSSILIQCERCGKGIRTGRFCDPCIAELRSGLAGTKVEKKKEVSVRNKMFTAERKK